ncbi:MAG: cyclic 2,3-diphosphoglycerate synthase [Candidatus Alcyoniella australis]|nr:cyclic 2,3-diphosphoglycerate synthase [Candidatus Alcyoniella australis]
MERIRILIAGAGGRDFHNFNTVFRDNEIYEVVAFTATQIPDIQDRTYPPQLAGRLYPEGIAIHDESQLERLIAELHVDQVIFSYSDVSHDYVMSLGNRVIAAGADFRVLSARATMLRSQKPMITVCAVRTGCGKSQTTRRIIELLLEAGKRVVAIRHPMPYGDLARQRVQRFAKMADFDEHQCTIEEREEYEPHIQRGNVVYAGVDYGAILAQAEAEADVIVWDGGNNDLPFYVPDLEIVVADPHRVGHELHYTPGTANLIRADVVIINKVDTANRADVEQLRKNIAAVNPTAKVIEAASPLSVVSQGGEQRAVELIQGKRVLVVEDGPTLTHGEMGFGVGVVAARKFGAAQLVDPRPYAVGRVAETFEKYTRIKDLLPAVGYGDEQVADLQRTINETPCDVVLIGTPIDLRRLVRIDKPTVRVTYELQVQGKPDLGDLLREYKLI